MKATIFSDPFANNPERYILVFPGTGEAPRLFLEWSAFAFSALVEVFTIIETKHDQQRGILFYIKFRTTHPAPLTNLYESAKEFINDHL